VIEKRQADFVEFEVVRLPAVARVPEPEPIPPPEEEEPPVPTTERPERVPENTRLRKVERARPFQPESSRDTGTREAPEDTEAVPAPSAPLPVLSMESTVGGAGTGDYVTTSERGGTVPVRAGRGGGRGGGPASGTGGPLANQDALDVKVSPDWEITEMPEPLNDRDFEPKYPALAKREGREAVVVVSLHIDASGRVVDAEVIEGPRGHGFGASALAYARKLRFRPAKAGSHEVASCIDWSIHFYVRN
jgi:protein TonB